MRLLIASQGDLAPRSATVVDELLDVERAERAAPPARSRLLQVLHVTRALDTALATVVSVRCLPPGPGENPNSIGSYLSHLCNRGTRGGRKLSSFERTTYQRTVADVRNRFMHQAGTIPTPLELNSLLGESEALLMKVLRM